MSPAGRSYDATFAPQQPGVYVVQASSSGSASCFVIVRVCESIVTSVLQPFFPSFVKFIKGWLKVIHYKIQQWNGVVKQKTKTLTPFFCRTNLPLVKKSCFEHFQTGNFNQQNTQQLIFFTYRQWPIYWLLVDLQPKTALLRQIEMISLEKVRLLINQQLLSFMQQIWEALEVLTQSQFSKTSMFVWFIIYAVAFQHVLIPVLQH